MNNDIILSGLGIHKMYKQGHEELKILKGIDIEIKKGEDLCIVGGSGAGKSTLLHILGALDRPNLGQIFFKGEDLIRKTDDELAKFRNKSVGFVFQFHHLLSEFNALENVAMPGRIGGKSEKDSLARAEELLSLLGLSDRMLHYPSELSGGERQRVAIARALAQEPEILLADEPTGNLDMENTRMIQNLFFDLKNKLGLTLLVVTHDMDFSSLFSRVMTLKGGNWVRD